MHEKRKPASRRYRPIRRPDYTMLEIPMGVTLIGLATGVDSLLIAVAIVMEMLGML